MPARVLVLGIDAASPIRLEAWMKDGSLPNIAALARRGILARTRSVDGFYIGSTWPSLFTGVSPARHGIHYLVQLRPGTYAFHRPDVGAFTPHAPFWSHLRREGRRVAVLDVPLTRVDTAIDGIQIVEWGSHDALHGFHAWPRSLEDGIRKQFGSHPAITPCDTIVRTAEGYGDFIDALLLGVRRKTDLTRHFLAQDDWDLFIQVFTEAHCAGHQAWHLHDGTHPAHDAALVDGIGDPLHNVYRAIDAAIGEIVNDAPGAAVVLFAAHGMAHWFGAQFLLPAILQRLGVARPLSPASRSAIGRAARAGARNLWRALPNRVREPLQPLRNRLRSPPTTSDLPSLPFDTARSACFPVPNGLAVGGIRLNLRNREPTGVLDTNSADNFVDDLADGLLGIIDERTGRPVVRRVLRTTELYCGERLDHLPDVLVEWDDTVPTGSTAIASGIDAEVRIRSPRIGELSGSNDYGRTGEHRPEGLLIAALPGTNGTRIERELSILDIAPTLAALLGASLPVTDGTVVPEMLARVTDG